MMNNEVNEIIEVLKENKYDPTTLSPEQLTILKEAAPAILDMVTKLSSSNTQSQARVYDTINNAMNMYYSQLDNPNLSDEARKDLNDRIERQTNKAIEKDSEHKNWLSKNVVAAMSIVAGGTLMALKNEKVQELAKDAIQSVLKKGK